MVLILVKYNNSGFIKMNTHTNAEAVPASRKDNTVV